jgi:hypothetical protein
VSHGPPATLVGPSATRTLEFDIPAKNSTRTRLCALTLLLVAGLAVAQTPQNAAPAGQQPAPPQDAQQPVTPHGDVLFQSHGDPPSGPEDTTAPALAAVVPEISPAARTSLLFTAYDLDAHLKPVASALTMHARLTVRNTGTDPLPRIALQISSSLAWESIALNGKPLALTQHLLDTDADHTGKVSEAVVTLPQPLAPGASITLDTLYSGVIQTDASRLERIGATPAQAIDTDWDAIGETALESSSDPDQTPLTLTATLRGFGNVIWYPVSAPPLFLGDGAKLFQAVGAMRLAESSAMMRLRIAVDYHGDPPTAAYFCGRREPMTAIADDPDQAIAAGTGIATAEFKAETLGFRLPSLFVVERPETLIAPLSGESSSAGETAPPASGETTEASLLAVETTDEAPLARLALAAQGIAPLLQKWLGTHPLSSLTVLDHVGEPFEDGPLLVAPVSSLAAASSTPALVHSLTHAWVQTGQPWMDEGIAQFMGLLWTEVQQGREAAIAQLVELERPVALAEPAFAAPAAGGADAVGQPLIAASDELYYRRKAAAVWWMLRGIVGDQPLAAALTTLAEQPASRASGEAQALAFEKLLEKTSGKELGWFFNDWVLRDRGLPDLTIAAVEPRQLPAGQGHDSGWLVAVTVRNDGAAAAEVPVVVRSGTFSTTKRIRVAGFSSVTDRVLVEAPPTEVLVNDGSTPEVRSSTHAESVIIKEPVAGSH